MFSLEKLLKSLKDKKIPIIFVIDLLFLGISYLLLTGYGKILQNKMATVSNGQTIEQLKQLLLTTPEVAEALRASLLSLLLLFFVGGGLVLLLLLLFYSFTRGLIWNYLNGTKITFKNYWRWNFLNILLLFLLIPLFIVFAIIKFSLTFLLTEGTTFTIVIDQGISLFFITTIFFFAFLLYLSFVNNYRIWKAVEKVFNTIKSRWTSIWRSFLLFFVAFIVLNLLLRWIGKFLGLVQGTSEIVTIIGILLFLSWMRLYLLKTIQG